MCRSYEQNDFRASGMVHNMGGPRSRSREEKVNSDFLADNKLEHDAMDLYFFSCPEGADPESILLDLGEIIGLHGWKEINRTIGLPDKKLLVRPLNENVSGEDLSPAIVLRMAMVLARCNALWYLPDGPAIYTRSRLQRRIRLVEFNTEDFYELD